MSYYKDGETPSSEFSPPPADQYQQYRYPPPSGHRSYYPPQLPPLPGSAPLPPVVHHQGSVSHGNDAQAALRSDGRGYTMPAATDQHYYESEPYTQVLPPASRRETPYFGQGPPSLPPVSASTELPNNLQEPSKIYQNSPYYSEAPNLETTGNSGSSESSSASSTTPVSHHHRPVPAKSAFMCFSEAKGKAISEKAGSKGGFVEVVAAEWRSLSRQEKAYWEGMARNEKTRFALEREAYKGPALGRKLRAKKHPNAPKRPMSAFLMYAQQKRRPLQQQNPDMPNADISRLLGELWRNASIAEKRPFLEREEVERKVYKAKMAAWKNDQKWVKATTTTSYAKRAARDDRQDESSFVREESHADERFDPEQNPTASYPPMNANETHQHPEGYYAKNQSDSSGPSYHHEFYDADNWTATDNLTATYNQQLIPNPVKYSYPRPPEDEHYSEL